MCIRPNVSKTKQLEHKQSQKMINNHTKSYKQSKLDVNAFDVKFPLWVVTLLLTYLGCHFMIKLCLFSLLESFSSFCYFSPTQAPNGL